MSKTSISFDTLSKKNFQRGEEIETNELDSALPKSFRTKTVSSLT